MLCFNSNSFLVYRFFKNLRDLHVKIKYITLRVIESIRPILGHGSHMTGAGAETEVMNSGRVPGQIERLGHLFELSGFAEHHFPHVHVWCETFVKMILLISLCFIFT